MSSPTRSQPHYELLSDSDQDDATLMDLLSYELTLAFAEQTADELYLPALVDDDPELREHFDSVLPLQALSRQLERHQLLEVSSLAPDDEMARRLPNL
ncbi:hypothetical protein MKX08_004095 [Trichoderma sp. CBMAI-0020]|nr:hypothetical protein MKX08_004095 [Trichoderma sp. CBMAI-0020]